MFANCIGIDIAVKGLVEGVSLPPVLQFSSEDKYTKVPTPAPKRNRTNG